MTTPEGIVLTREQLEAWAGRALEDHDLAELARVIPHSSVPDAVAAIVESWEEQ